MSHHRGGTADNPCIIDDDEDAPSYRPLPLRRDFIDLSDDNDADPYSSGAGTTSSKWKLPQTQSRATDFMIVSERPVKRALDPMTRSESSNHGGEHFKPTASTSARTKQSLDFEILEGPPAVPSSTQPTSLKAAQPLTERISQISARVTQGRETNAHTDERQARSSTTPRDSENGRTSQAISSEATPVPAIEAPDHRKDFIQAKDMAASTGTEVQKSRELSAPRIVARKSAQSRSFSTPQSVQRQTSATGTEEAQRSSSSILNSTPRGSSEGSQAPAGKGASELTSRISRKKPQKAHTRHTLEISIEQVTREELVKSLVLHLTDFHENHAYDVQNYLRVERTGLERSVLAQKKNGTWFPSFVPTIAEDSLQTEDPFAELESIELQASAPSSTADCMTLAVEEFGESQTCASKTYLNVATSRFNSSAPDVPQFHEYVHLNCSVLTENYHKLIYFPYFDDDQHEEGSSKTPLWENLRDKYQMANESRPLHVLRDEQCRTLGPYLENFLEEMNLDWDDIMFWFLAQDSNIQQIDPAWTKTAEFQSLLTARNAKSDEGKNTGDLFDRGSAKFERFFAELITPSPRNLRLSAIACAEFLKYRKFSMWHLARRSDSTRARMLHLAQSSFKTKTNFSYRDRLCRICHEHDCPYHGEIQEGLLSATDSDGDRDQHAHGSSKSQKRNIGNVPERPTSDLNNDDDTGVFDESESDIEKVLNYRRIVNVPGKKIPRQDSTTSGQVLRLPFRIKQSERKDDINHSRRPFYPCDHEGSCEPDRCRCAAQGRPCEKTCRCSSSCQIRFPGCSCKADPRSKACTREKKCLCIQLRRECDEDLCGSCGAAEVLDPINRYDREIVEQNCGNVNLQRAVPRKTLLGNSELHGFGLYIAEEIKQHDFIAEYKGEVVTHDEADRRGTLYQHMKTNYLFRLNKGQEVDSTRAGNKTRFINHASDEHSNCEVKVLLCNNVVRIGIYTTKSLKAGTELLFNYGEDYIKGDAKDFRTPGDGHQNKKGVAQKIEKKKPPSTMSSSQRRDNLQQKAERRKQDESARKARALRRGRKDADVDAGEAPTLARKTLQSHRLGRSRIEGRIGLPHAGTTSSSTQPYGSQSTIPETDLEDEGYNEDDGEEIEEEEEEEQQEAQSENADEDQIWEPIRHAMESRSRSRGRLVQQEEEPRRAARKSRVIPIMRRTITNERSQSSNVGKRKRLVGDEASIDT